MDTLKNEELESELAAEAKQVLGDDEVVALGFDPDVRRTAEKITAFKAEKLKKLTLKDQRIWVEWVLTVDSNVELALRRIYERQTSDEQNSHTTKHQNSRGFGAFDAEFGTSTAKGLLKYGHLTPKQVGHARKMVLRYWRQLVECARAKGRLPETMPEACARWAARQQDLDEVAGEEVAS